MTEISYRLAQDSDIKDFFTFFSDSIHHQFTAYTPRVQDYFVEKDYHLTWLTKAVSEKSKIIFLALSDKKIIGYLMVSKVYGGVSMANWIAVSPNYQRRGIAKELLNMWEKWSLKSGAHSLQLWTENHNLDFYQKRGFFYGGNFPNGWFGVDTNLFYKNIANHDESRYLPSIK